MANKRVTVKYRYYTNGSWSAVCNSSVQMDNPNPSESMIRNKVMSMHSNYDDVEIIDFKVQ